MSELLSNSRMTVSEIMKKMIEHSEGNLHDINHFIKVWSYAKLIGELEGLDSETQYVLEVTAIIHDIACPLCRIKYGNASGKHQEEESWPLVMDFLQGCGLTDAQMERIAYLVSHHHTYTGVDKADYQILLEADYLVNADESKYSVDHIRHTLETVFKTESGKALLMNMFQL